MSSALGAKGERIAEAHLRSKGMKIIERNFRRRFGEIDLIARDGDAVVFVEVKYRSGAAFGLAQEAVGAAKRRKIIAAARAYLQTRDLDCPARFDVVAVSGDRIEHFESAFDAF